MTIRIRNTTDKHVSWSPKFEWEPGQTIDVEDHHFANHILSEKGFEKIDDPDEQERLFLARLHHGTQHPAAPKSTEITAEDKALAREIAKDKAAVDAADEPLHHDDTTGGWQSESADDQGAEQRLETAAEHGTGKAKERSAARKR